MNRNFRRWNSIWVGPAIAFTFLLVVTCPVSTVAQTNTFPSTGNVGVGTTTPAVPVDVKAANVSWGGQLRLQAPDWAQITFYNENNPALSSANRLGSISYEMASTSLYIDANMGNKRLLLQSLGGGGNVGIGLTAPTYKLHVNGSFNATSINLNGSPVISSQWLPNGTAINYSAGFVGIGTSTPATKLHVVGDITVTGNIAAKYQDVAEWVPAATALPAGMVVTLDPTKTNHVVASSEAYDTRVAGVISAQPGITLGERGDNKVLVATTGRVKLKVDASHGPIRVGDLLVTSDIPGVAMKSQPIDVGGVKIHRPGTLIGKALEPLATGRGEILVLLSLQ
jgi:hypothetical protein